MISASKALELIRSRIVPLGPVTLGIDDAVGCALGEDIVSTENIPHFDNSAMDGYALHSASAATAPVRLRVVAEVAAGVQSEPAVGSGECAAIMTGARIPPGCDAVIQHELVNREGDSITVARHVKAGTNVRRAGADVAANSVVFRKGTVLRPQEIGVLASIGRQFVSVVRKPVVAVLATGNELVGIDKRPGPGQIRNSNVHSIMAAVREEGALVRSAGTARDTSEDLHMKLESGLGSDVLITIGGVSAGKYDLVVGELNRLGVETVFWKVNIKPGMPLFFGMRGATPVFGLPGNAVSSLVTFLQFVRPAIASLSGKTAQARPRVTARLAELITKTDGKRHFMRGVTNTVDGALTVRSTGSQISNIMTSLSTANCLIILPEERESFAAGDFVEIEWL